MFWQMVITKFLWETLSNSQNKTIALTEKSNFVTKISTYQPKSPADMWREHKLDKTRKLTRQICLDFCSSQHRWWVCINSMFLCLLFKASKIKNPKHYQKDNKFMKSINSKSFAFLYWPYLNLLFLSILHLTSIYQVHLLVFKWLIKLKRISKIAGVVC